MSNILHEIETLEKRLSSLKGNIASKQKESEKVPVEVVGIFRGYIWSHLGYNGETVTPDEIELEKIKQSYQTLLSKIGLHSPEKSVNIRNQGDKQIFVTELGLFFK